MRFSCKCSRSFIFFHCSSPRHLRSSAWRDAGKRESIWICECVIANRRRRRRGSWGTDAMWGKAPSLRWPPRRASRRRRCGFAGRPGATRRRRPAGPGRRPPAPGAASPRAAPPPAPPPPARPGGGGGSSFRWAPGKAGRSLRPPGSPRSPAARRRPRSLPQNTSTYPKTGLLTCWAIAHSIPLFPSLSFLGWHLDP